jgi:hypothetical protein
MGLFSGRRELGVNESLGGGALGGGGFGVDVYIRLGVSCWQEGVVDGGGEGRYWGTYMGESHGMWLLEAWLYEVDVGNGD